MEEGIYDIVVDELKNIQGLVREELRDRFKGQKPFRQEPVSEREELLMADELTPEKKNWLIEQFGVEATAPFFARIEKLKKKYGVD